MTSDQEMLVGILDISNDLEKLQAADAIRELDEQLESMRRFCTVSTREVSAADIASLLHFIRKWCRHDSHCGLCYGSNDCTCGFWEELDLLKVQIHDPFNPDSPVSRPPTLFQQQRSHRS